MNNDIFQKMKKGTYIIAEMSANHAGKLENALEIVRLAAKAGADCLKIQTYTADTLTLDCDSDDFIIKGGLWNGYKLYDLYKQASTPYEWHKAIKDECEKYNVDFLSTPFDSTAVDFLEELQVDFYKIASFELVDIPLIEYAASKGKPMIMSCGMGSIEEIHDAVDACKRMGNEQIVLLKCCSEYPANFEDMKLANIADMQKRFPGCVIGFSDHSMGSLAPVIATTLGAKVIEKHVCLSRDIKNPDSDFSMEIDEFAQMVKDVRNTHKIIGQVSYDLTEGEKKSTVFRRSIYATKDIKKGEYFTKDNIRVVRPGYGEKPKHYKDIVNKKSACDIDEFTPIKISDVQYET